MRTGSEVLGACRSVSLSVMEPREILPGVFHWMAAHPKIRVEVSSYWLADARVLLDPLLPEGGLAWLRQVGPPEDVILTNRHHWRHCSDIVAEFGCPVWCNALGLHEVEEEPGHEKVRGFRAGDVLPGGIESYEVGALCPDGRRSASTSPGTAPASRWPTAWCAWARRPAATVRSASCRTR